MKRTAMNSVWCVSRTLRIGPINRAIKKITASPSDDLQIEDARIGSALRWWGVLDEAHGKPPDIQFNGGYNA
jgi:hypothetical protein